MTMTDSAALLIGILASVTDMRSHRIPNALTFAAAAAALLFHSTAPAGMGIGAGLVGLIAGLAIFFPLFALGAMGAGDVKLMAALGAWMGWQPIIFVALYGAVAGGVLALVVAARHRYTRTAVTNVRTLLTHWWLVGIKPLPALTLESGTAMRLPYAFPILVGVVVTIWLH